MKAARCGDQALLSAATGRRRPGGGNVVCNQQRRDKKLLIVRGDRTGERGKKKTRGDEEHTGKETQQKTSTRS